MLFLICLRLLCYESNSTVEPIHLINNKINTMKLAILASLISAASAFAPASTGGRLDLQKEILYHMGHGTQIIERQTS